VATPDWKAEGIWDHQDHSLTEEGLRAVKIAIREEEKHRRDVKLAYLNAAVPV
jgi:hypothetical protein